MSIINLGNENVVYVYKDYWNEVQKKLKALEVIKKKMVNTKLIMQKEMKEMTY